LRFLESWQALQPLRGFQVKDFKCAILESGDEQALALYVDLHVIEAALYIGESDRLDKLQGLLLAILGVPQARAERQP
jgi:hypothetical protein